MKQLIQNAEDWTKYVASLNQAMISYYDCPETYPCVVVQTEHETHNGSYYDFTFVYLNDFKEHD